MTVQDIVSTERVRNHGEVYTRKREVNAMLDLVKQETERIDSRFLEPACGKGNFLVEILARKLKVIENRYKKNQLDYERNTFVAVGSIYGIDLLEDNVQDCRNRLFYLIDEHYHALFQTKTREEFLETIKYVLSKNIVLGDALTMKTNGGNPQPIVFSEWAIVKGSMVKRRDFVFRELCPKERTNQPSLFDKPNEKLVSDQGEDAFIPEPIKDYPVTPFLEVANV